MTSAPGALPAPAVGTRDHLALPGADEAASPACSAAESLRTGTRWSPLSCKRKRGWGDPETPPPCFLGAALGDSFDSIAPSASAGTAPPSREARAVVLTNEGPLDPLTENPWNRSSEHPFDQSSEHPFDPPLEQPSGPSPDQPLRRPAPPPLPHPPDAVPPTPKEPEPKLCQEQKELVDLIAGGRNVFYTGSAGCGKSTVLKAALQRLKDMGLIVHVLAPTGRAALQVNGVTTWSYMGWTPDCHKYPMDKLTKLAFRKHVRRRLKSTDVLIIDEISMVENHHFERINLAMKEARRWKDNHVAAFGGAQVVVTGDFCQLPPVKPFQYCIICGDQMQMDEHEIEFDCPNNHGPFREHDKWAFMSDAWEECDFTHVHLTQIHRQNDQHFINMLQKCRLGLPFSTDETTTLMDHPCNVTNATRLFSTRGEVTRVNLENFSKLRTPVITYQTLDGFVWQHDEHPNLEHYNDRLPDGSLAALQDHRLERRVELRIGMLVVLQVNLDLRAGLCNGSQGIICGFEDHDPAKIPKAKASSASDADESSIHGKSWKGPSMEPADTWKDGATIRKNNHEALRERQVMRFMSKQQNKVWPRVLFHCGEKRTIYAGCVVNSVGNREPYSLLHRTQVPLVAAWAMSIHKSQGMTLDRVIVNLTKAFEEGQVYVALSRATSLEGLKVEGSPDGLAVGRGGNPDVQQFLREKFGVKLLREHSGMPKGARDRFASQPRQARLQGGQECLETLDLRHL